MNRAKGHSVDKDVKTTHGPKAVSGAAKPEVKKRQTLARNAVVIAMSLFGAVGCTKNETPVLVSEGVGQYIGEFDENKTGRGKFISDNMRAEGNFINGKLNGQGKMTKMGEIYQEVCEGTFKNGLLNGQGMRDNTLSGKATGTFKNGLLNGQGKIVEYGGTVREGEFKDDLLQGRGTVTHSNGSMETGEFDRNHLKDGYAIEVITSNGVKMAVETSVKNGVASGTGRTIDIF